MELNRIQQVYDEVSLINFALFSGDSSYFRKQIETILNDTVLDGGKRLRPTLLVLFGRFMGLKFQNLIPYARAVEMAHAATLAHDDVIDEAQERRNRLTMNAQLSNSHAVLGGDFLLARVIAEISSLGELEIVHDMAKVLEDLVAGEWLQLESRRMAHSDRQRLILISEKKTASLFSWCCATPARLKRTNAIAVELARDFGTQVGIAFQMVDDLVDFEPLSGKALFKDFHEGLMNYVTCEFLAKHPEKKDHFVSNFGRPTSDTSTGSMPWSEADLEESKEAVRVLAEQRIDRAKTLLDSLKTNCLNSGVQVDEDAYLGLRDLLSEILVRKK